MNQRLQFNPLQAQEVAAAFNEAGVDDLFIGKSAAILLDFPGTTQNVDIFPEKSEKNGAHMVGALLQIGFELDDLTQKEIIRGKDFVQLKNGPFDLDLIFAPDGIESFAQAKSRANYEGIFPIASLKDIIASKKATGRMKDRLDLHLLELFRLEFERNPS